MKATTEPVMSVNVKMVTINLQMIINRIDEARNKKMVN